MQTHDQTVQALVERVAKLEAQNRWLRKAGIAALVAASVMVIMGQARTSRVLEANEFVLKDTSGTVRARLSVAATTEPTLKFFDRDENISASLVGGDEPVLFFAKESGKKASVLLSKDGVSMWGKAGTFTIDLSEDGPSLNISDNEGYSTTLGRSDLVVPASGRKERTPAASLVLFGKDKKVLWSAP